MTLIVCVDDRLGMAFNRRRQSRDRIVCQDMVNLAADAPIQMEERSATLFENLDGNILATGFSQDPAPDACCFVEFQPVDALAQKADKIVLYRWNRHYPADLYFDVSLSDWRQTEVTEFPGSSHETITREVYIREK